MRSKERVKRAKYATRGAKRAPKGKPVGRPKLYESRANDAFHLSWHDRRIHAVSAKGETRADLIRVAIEREIERRIRTHR